MSSIGNQSVVKSVPAWLTLFLAISCGIIVANLYYAQPLVGDISSAIGLSQGAAGLIVTLTQIGYGIGLLFIVPLGDVLENRRLVVGALLLTTLALIAAAVVQSASLFLLTAMMIGIGSVAAQILVPYAAQLAPDESRGRVVGNVMSGLLLGIMLARPISSMVADLMGWRAIFVLSSALILILALVLAKALPARQPVTNESYLRLIGSMWRMLETTPILQRRAINHAFVFGTFSLFWTTVPLLLTSPEFHFSQMEVALFALAGVSGAIAAPIAGRLADRGWIRPATGLALAAVIISVVLPFMVHTRSITTVSILVISAILLDMGVSANLVLSQRVIFALGAEFRSRLNGLFMAIFFAGGALGSAAGGWAYNLGGWKAALVIGIALPSVAMIYYLTRSSPES
ncbi:MFS transporter [Paenibacillus sp. P96]|uniref:MFS transporter n=1 Tax=Paenibacillus zeirhizosphaerae TaxID=2987519 RepID=A0ABT9FTM4_9BACL|nr:MFS transporter [Paenibacillus sp. P96]MDP4097970.1 MFS transporter [Paenibacillus sp. P96]